MRRGLQEKEAIPENWSHQGRPCRACWGGSWNEKLRQLYEVMRLNDAGRDWRLRRRQGCAGLEVRDHLTQSSGTWWNLQRPETHLIHHPTLGRERGSRVWQGWDRTEYHNL